MPRWPQVNRRRRHSPPLRQFMGRPSSPTLATLRDFMDELADEKSKEGIRQAREASLQKAKPHNIGRRRRMLDDINRELIEVRERLDLPVRALQRLNYITVQNIEDLDAVVQLRERWGYNGSIKIYKKHFATTQEFNALCHAAEGIGFARPLRILQG